MSLPDLTGKLAVVTGASDGIGLGSSSVPEGNQGDTSRVDRSQLADFLRTRREALQPEDVGLPRGQRRRTGGLRREEVAALSGMSADYYSRRCGWRP